MKKIIFPFLFMLLYLSGYAQMQDLTNLAEGKLVYSTIVYDNDNELWGYFYLYKSDKEKDKDKMEYVVLDKNLNKTNNGTYFRNKINESHYYRIYNKCVLLGDQLVLDLSYIRSAGFTLAYNTIQSISLLENTVSEELFFEKGKFNVLPENALKSFFAQSKVDSLGNSQIVSPIYRGTKKGFILSQSNPYFQVREKEILFYNESREFLWKYKYNNNTSNKLRDKYTSFRFLNFNNDRILAAEYDYVKTKNTSVRIVALNFNTGIKEFEYNLQNDTSRYIHNFVSRVYNDSLYISGQYFNNKKYGSDATYLGYFRIIIDKNGKEINKKYLSWKEVSTPEIAVSDKGKILRTHEMNRKAVMIYNDGAVTVINEEFRTQPFLFTMISTFSFFILDFYKAYLRDVYVYNFDKNFNFTGVSKVKKGKNFLDTDYIYSQYVKKNSGSVVCFTSNVDVNNKMEKNLLITNIIDGKIQTESIPLTSKKEFFIVPIPAKEGYIMLHEYNEKKKYNQIRLEKLNN